MKEKFKSLINEWYRGMMSGISYFIPVVISGAMLFAIPNIWTEGMASEATSGLAYYMYTWGQTLFGMMYYILGMYTAFGIGGRPAMVGGLVAGIFAATTNAGFIGAVVGGIVAGYVAKGLVKYLKLPTMLSAAKSILFIPVISAFIMFIVMQFALEPLGSGIMVGVYSIGKLVESWGLLWVLRGVFGLCGCVGMGGPIGWGMFTLEQIYMEGGDMVVCAVILCSCTAGCLGTAIAVKLFKKKFPANLQNITGLLTGWLVMITEFQLPYFIQDLKTFIPCYMLSGFTGGALISLLNVTTPTWHGGIYTMLMASNIFKYAIAMLAQAAVVVIYVGLFKKDLPDDEWQDLEQIEE